jgi:hypothetical protein
MDPFEKRTFWEKLGRGVAQGWEKAKETSSRLGEIAGVKLDLKSARDHLETRYRLLGRIVADRLIDRSEGTLDPAEPQVAGLLEEIRAGRAAIVALEAKLAEETAPPAGPSSG